MRKAVVVIGLACLLGGSFPVLQDVLHAATCTGASPCNACKNCKYCKRCAKDGGTCGTCRRR